MRAEKNPGPLSVGGGRGSTLLHVEVILYNKIEGLYLLRGQARDIQIGAAALVDAQEIISGHLERPGQRDQLREGGQFQSAFVVRNCGFINPNHARQLIL